MVANLLSSGLVLVQLFAALALGKPSQTPLYKDPKAPVEKRVKDLLSRMTIEDKRAQLMQGMSLSQSPTWRRSDC
jgi:beta-glucosidase